MESEIKRIVEGNASIEDFDVLEIYTCKGKFELSAEFASILQYSILKHPHYSLMRDFEYDELSFFQIFSLIVNKQDDKAKSIIEKKNYYINLNFLRFCVVDDFPPASEDMCRWLQNRVQGCTSILCPCPIWSYLITSWCIMSSYKLDGLKYARDHLKIAERTDAISASNIKRHFEKHDVTCPQAHDKWVYDACNISIYILKYEDGRELYTASYCETPGADDQVFNKNADFNKQEDSIDNACKLGLKHCDRVPKFRKLINSVDYWNHLKEMDDE